MRLHAIRCQLALRGSDLVSIEPWTGLPDALANAPDVPLAFLVRSGDVAWLREQRSTLVDRGRKHRAKSLASLLLRQTGVPLIVGDFRSSGQLVRSVRTLLQHARKNDERNAYVIAVSNEMFEEVSKRAKRSSLPAATGPAGRGMPPSLISRAGDEGTFPASEYLNLLDDDEVPKELEKTLVGESPEIALVRQWIVLASRHSEPVLILGDTGTGKEIAARAIHELDPLRGLHSFLPVNCGAISPELFEPELFGYVPGAFTDARKNGNVGMWRKAGLGTLFLDEIGDLALRHQVKILRVLEESKIRPVGAVEEVKVHCRVIAATNRDVYAMVQSGEFREDLYYRLRPFLIRTPRLRDHLQDVPVLARFFWKTVAAGRPPLSETVLAVLARYRWPGNARELRAVLVSLATMFPKIAPRGEHVRAVFQMQSPTRLDDESLGAADDARLHRAECLRHVRRADEVIRACKVVLRPYGGGRADEAVVRRIRIALAHRLAELQVLGMQPLLFHSIATFDVVHRLAGRLATLQSLIGEAPAEAQRFWRKEVASEVTDALSVLVREAERLLKKL